MRRQERVLALCVALCCVASTVATTPSLRTLLAEQDTHTGARGKPIPFSWGPEGTR
jgi:hypothetical protein